MGSGSRGRAQPPTGDASIHGGVPAGELVAGALSREALEVVLQSVAEGITVQDPTGALLYANDAAARLIGYPSAKALLEVPVEEVMERFEVLDEEGRVLDPA